MSYNQLANAKTLKDVEYLRNFNKKNPCGALCRLKQNFLYPKLHKLGTKIAGEHLLMDMLIDLQARDGKTGKVKNCKHLHAQSWVRQFADLQFACYLPGAVNRTLQDITNTSRTMDVDDFRYETSDSGMFAIYATVKNGAATSNANIGIVIGSGTAAVDISDFALASKLVTDVTHQVMILDEAYNAPDSVTRQFKFIRHFTNRTGGTININEIAMYSHSTYDDSVAATQFCIERTKLGAAFPVDDDDVGIVGYTIQLLGA